MDKDAKYWIDAYIELGKISRLDRLHHPVTREYNKVANLLPEEIQGIFDYCVYKAREAMEKVT